MPEIDFFKEPFELLRGESYLVIKPCNGLIVGQIVKYIGVRQSPVERGYETHHLFQQASDRVITVSIEDVPETVGESFSYFQDVVTPLTSMSEPFRRVVNGLKHRCHVVREVTAESISLDIGDLTQVIPILVSLALHSKNARNVFVDALCRLNPESLSYVEVNESNLNNISSYEMLVAKLGGKKFKDQYLADIKSSQIIKVRKAITYLSVIADSQAVDALKSLLEHPNFNIRTDARDALEEIGKRDN